MSVATAKKLTKKQAAGRVVHMFINWLQTGLVTGLLAILISYVLIVLAGPVVGYRLAWFVVTALVVVVSWYSLASHVHQSEGQRLGWLATKAAEFAQSIFLSFIREDDLAEDSGWWHRAQINMMGWFSRTFDGPTTSETFWLRVLAFAGYTAATCFSGAIVVQGAMYERLGFRPRRWMTVWGAGCFGIKFAIIYGSAALAIRDGGAFWSNVRSAFGF